MKANPVWDLVDLPPEPQTISKKWVLKIKRKVDGSIERYKAPLVAKGFQAGNLLYYEDTFPPVLRLVSIRLILAILAHMDL